MIDKSSIVEHEGDHYRMVCGTWYQVEPRSGKRIAPVIVYHMLEPLLPLEEQVLILRRRVDALQSTLEVVTATVSRLEDNANLPPDSI